MNNTTLSVVLTKLKNNNLIELPGKQRLHISQPSYGRKN